MAAYRASKNEATGYTPNMLVFGHEVRAPVDIVYGSPTEAPAQTYNAYVEHVRERMTEAYEEVRIALRKAAELNKRYYDVRVKTNTYAVGDWVYYFNPRSSEEDKTNGNVSTLGRFWLFVSLRLSLFVYRRIRSRDLLRSTSIR